MDTALFLPLFVKITLDGVAQFCPVDSVENARELRARHPDWFDAGPLVFGNGPDTPEWKDREA